MRVLLVSHFLPDSLTLEQIKNESEPIPISKKNVSKTFSSTGQVRSTASTSSLLKDVNKHSSESDVSPQHRRLRSQSSLSRRSSISVIGNATSALEALTISTPHSSSSTTNTPTAHTVSNVWKFEEIPAHPSLAAASGLEDSVEKLFVGWPGPIFNEKGEKIDYSSLDEELINQMKSLYATKTSSVPIFLDSSIAHGHLNYCNKTIWPIFHYVVWDNIMQCKEMPIDYKDYVKVNEAFAEKILDIYKAGDQIWILDHQLLLLPELLRRKLQSVPIAIYLRNTFPSSELFRCVPQADELLKGILGANLVGFQAYAYARHFTSCCTRVLGLEASLQSIDYNGAPVELTVVPTGIDPTSVFEYLNSAEVKEKLASFSELFRDLFVIIGIDPLDQMNGVLHKFKGYEHFLQDNPEYLNRVVLVQILLPESDISSNFSEIIDFSTQINSRHGSIEYTPISIYYQDIDLAEYYALLQVADCFISTKERDSLSLVPLDYVLCQEQSGKKNPLILSEFTALSGSLSTSILINPFDRRSVSESIKSALTMSSTEKESRHEILLNYVKENTSNDWSKKFYNNFIEINSIIQKYGPSPYLDVNLLKECYAKSVHRYFFLDYDGTLTPIVKTPSAAAPGSMTLKSLQQLTADPKNHIFIVSGRDCTTLEHWLGGIEGLGMSAEHGCYLKMPGCTEWQDLIVDHNEDWKKDVAQVFEYFTQRTPGSFIERKRASITWHYRQSDPEFGTWQAKQCQSLLENTVSGKMAVEILAGKKNLEVRPVSVNKGQVLQKILSEGTSKLQSDFIFCAGDDRTDEDMFKALSELKGSENVESEPHISPFNENNNKNNTNNTANTTTINSNFPIFTCTIGSSEKKSLARFHVNNPEQLVNFLFQLTSNDHI